MSFVRFHSECVSCKSQELYGITACNGCRYLNAEWDLPSLKIQLPIEFNDDAIDEVRDFVSSSFSFNDWIHTKQEIAFAKEEPNKNEFTEFMELFEKFTKEALEFIKKHSKD